MKTPKSTFIRVSATLLALACVPFAFAQSDKPAEKAPADKGGQRGGPGGRGDQLKMMTDRLKLTEEQQAKIKPLLEEQRAEGQKLRDAGLSREEMMKKREEMNAQLDAKLAPILTAEQKTELKAMREEMRARMRDGGGQRPGGGRPPRDGGEGKGDKSSAPKD